MNEHNEVELPPMRLERHAAYEYSGVEWLRDVPAHWQIRRLKTLASIQLSNVDKKSMDVEEPVRLCNYTDVYYHDRITADMDFMQATATHDQVRRFSLRANDVLITKDSESWTDIAVPSVVTEDLSDVLCGYHLAQIRPDDGELDGTFLSRAISAIGPRDQFQVAANGITRFGIGRDVIATAVLAVPPIDEQRRIAAFLDRQTARIDALVDKKKRLIELLHEDRVALITRAVTQGLDPSVSTKDSGIASVGEIPVHWELKRIKVAATKVGSGKTPSGGADVYVSDGIMLLRSQNVHFRGLRLDDVAFIDRQTDADMAYSRVQEGDVLLNITGASLGRCCVARLGGKLANVNQHVCIIRPRSSVFDSSFMANAIASQPGQSQIFTTENGISRDALNFQQIGAFALPCPPLHEQLAIARALEQETAKIDTLAAKIRNAIARLGELRAALVSAAVTGRIDVRGKAA